MYSVTLLSSNDDLVYTGTSTPFTVMDFNGQNKCFIHICGGLLGPCHSGNDTGSLCVSSSTEQAE